ncbi:hypothetical protein KIPB_005391 [Kipferlia bialata]|uniref:C3H1-type domain-containing protein n=1 Tax=Kipferlia bialata TaxID=797122 RepID=A0A9K3GJ07_9EUKA|nr:hypothetical protein KIPB_005391 [Kipferlia bialata]|eukprot:g5391.t1
MEPGVSQTLGRLDADFNPWFGGEGSTKGKKIRRPQGTVRQAREVIMRASSGSLSVVPVVRGRGSGRMGGHMERAGREIGEALATGGTRGATSNEGRKQGERERDARFVLRPEVPRDTPEERDRAALMVFKREREKEARIKAPPKYKTISNRICRFYLEGRCHYGDECKDIHPQDITPWQVPLYTPPQSVWTAPPAVEEERETVVESTPDTPLFQVSPLDEALLVSLGAQGCGYTEDLEGEGCDGDTTRTETQKEVEREREIVPDVKEEVVLPEPVTEVRHETEPKPKKRPCLDVANLPESFFTEHGPIIDSRGREIHHAAGYILPMPEGVPPITPQEVVVFVGLPGSGKSTLFRDRYEGRGYVRVNQDELGSRKSCERMASRALKAGRSVVIDRCNFDRSQRAHWVRLAEDRQDAHPAKYSGASVSGTVPLPPSFPPSLLVGEQRRMRENEVILGREIEMLRHRQMEARLERLSLEGQEGEREEPTASAATSVRPVSVPVPLVKCVWLTTDLDTASCLNTHRARGGGRLVPETAIRGMHSQFEKPTLAEGFDHVEKISIASSVQSLPDVSKALEKMKRERERRARYRHTNSRNGGGSNRQPAH